MEEFENEIRQICRCLNWVVPTGYEWELFRHGYEPNQALAVLETWRREIIQGSRSAVYPYKKR